MTLPRLIVLALLAALAGAAVAQERQTPWSIRNEPRVTADELEGFLRDQGLEKSDAGIILRSAHDDLMRIYAERAAKRAAENERIQKAQTEWFRANPPSPEQMMRQPSFSRPEFEIEMRTERERIEREFHEVALAVLPGPAAREWQHFADSKRRGHVIGELAFTGGRGVGNPYVDLIEIADEAGLDAADMTAIEPLLEAYRASMAASVDRLQERENALIAVFFGTNVTPEEAETPAGRAKQERLGEAATELQSLRQALLAVIDGFRPQIEAALSESGRARFERTIRRRTWPQIYLRDPVDLVMARLANEPLPSSVQADLDAIVSEYEHERDRILEQLVDAFQRWEAPSNEETVREFRQYSGIVYQARREGRPLDSIDPEPVTPYMFEPLRARHDLCRRTMARMAAIFSASERAMLPADIRLCLEWAIGE